MIITDRNGYIYYFDNGDLTETYLNSTSLSGKIVYDAWADANKRVYYRVTESGCTNHKIKAVDPDSDLSVLSYDLGAPCSMGPGMYAKVPNGKFATLTQSNYNASISRYATSGVTTDLSGSVPSGYIEFPVRMDSDTDGNIVYVSDRINLGTGKANVVIRLFDFTNSSVTEIWNAVSAIPGQDNISHYLGGDIRDGYLYIPICLVQCYPNSQTASQIYKIELSGFGDLYQTLGAFAVPTPSTELEYVAMGDSFSSGEGNPPYLFNTDVDNYNTCHRSKGAYPLLLEAEPSLALNLTGFPACSGAEIKHIINSSNLENSEPPQAAMISTSTDLVTMSIGGNDIGFGHVLQECTLVHELSPGKTQDETDQAYCATALDDARTVLESTAFEEDLATTYAGVASLGGDDTKLIIVGYPQLYPEYANITEACTWGTNPGSFGLTSGRDVSESEINEIRSLTSDLNDLLSTNVGTLEDSNVRFADPSSRFVGHELCTSVPYFTGVHEVFDLVDVRASFHPNVIGQSKYFITIYSMLIV